MFHLFLLVKDILQVYKTYLKLKVNYIKFLGFIDNSLRRKRFRLVSEQRPRNGIFAFASREMNQEPNNDYQ